MLSIITMNWTIFFVNLIKSINFSVKDRFVVNYSLKKFNFFFFWRKIVIEFSVYSELSEFGSVSSIGDIKTKSS